MLLRRAGFNNRCICERAILHEGVVMNECIDILKYMLLRDQPDKLDDDNKKRRMMTITSKKNYYVEDIRFKDSISKKLAEDKKLSEDEKSTVMNNIVFTNSREDIWYGKTPLPLRIHQMDIIKSDTVCNLSDINKSQAISVQDLECVCGTCMGIGLSKPNKEGCPCKDFIHARPFATTTIIRITIPSNTVFST